MKITYKHSLLHLWFTIEIGAQRETTNSHGQVAPTPSSSILSFTPQRGCAWFRTTMVSVSFFFPSHVYISLSCCWGCESNGNRKKISATDNQGKTGSQKKKNQRQKQRRAGEWTQSEVKNKVLPLGGQTSLADALTPLPSDRLLFIIDEIRNVIQDRGK